MRQKVAKYERRIVKKYINTLLSNMNFWDRVKFAIYGNYYKALKKTEKNLAVRDHDIGGAK